jgi:hypothetical protein
MAAMVAKMKKTLRGFLAFGLAATVLLLPCSVGAAGNITQPGVSAGAVFSDVPADSWAAGAIESAVNNNLMNGLGGGLFGYGKTMTRAEFVTVLCKMFDWSEVSPDKPTFADAAPGQWFYGYAEAAAANGVVQGSGYFNPNEPIIREDMAVMLVKALGYDVLEQQAEKTEALPFDDVTRNKGYITVAHDLGIIGGIGGGKFAPGNTAKREEAATMLTRVYDKLKAQTDWLHGFYAFSSYSQRDFITRADAVTFGWSAMEWSAESGAKLNTSATGNNQWRVPEAYELIADYPRENGIKANLGVYMDSAMDLYGFLADEKAQSDAVDAIINETSRTYDAIGRNPYDGVTIDFEGIKGANAKSAYTAFLSKLAGSLKSRGLALYVAVQAVTSDGQYFDGYDYRKIGQIADKVILMAHNYQPTSLDGFVGTEWHKNAALTPIAEIYKALKAVTDAETGVEDRGKIALAFNLSCVGWEIDDIGKVKSPDPVSPAMETVISRMNRNDTLSGRSEAYRNPYITYTTEAGERIFLWYEDSVSIAEKLKLARLFGVTGVSVWRIGIIPNYNEWNVWDILTQ